MSKTHLNTPLKHANFVLLFWVCVFAASVILPKGAIQQGDYTLVRVCSLVTGVQYIKLPLENAGKTLSAQGHHIDPLHANCKCGLNVDHLSTISTDIQLVGYETHRIYHDYGRIFDAPQSYNPYVLSRAPPV